MKLIVDTYDIPALRISKLIFKMSNVEHITLHKLLHQSLNTDCVYYIHKEEGSNLIKYYFNEIVEVENNLVYINKMKKVIKYFYISDGKEIQSEYSKTRDVIDKSRFLPFLKVQEDEVVIFPDVEEDDE